MSENFHLESNYLNASTKKRPKDIGIKYQESIHENELTPEVQGGQLLTMATNQNTLKSEERVKELKNKTKWTRARVKHLRTEDHSLLPPMNISVEPRIKLAQKRDAIRSHSHHCWENQHQETKNITFETNYFLEENVSHSSIEIQM